MLSVRVPLLLAVSALLAACATTAPLEPAALAAELGRRPVVMAGEVHDNVAMQKQRAQALRILLEGGARPAVAFEQFDRDRQADIDRARREPVPPDRSLADSVIDAGRAPRDGWDWTLYKPYVELALQYDLPIVAANLSRADAGRVARQGAAAVFSAAELQALDLGRFEALLAQQERIVQAGHCDMLPASALPGLARAQIARDAVLARSLAPHLERGVILLTGNGHARRDIGVPAHLPASQQARIWSIGLLEEGSDDDRARHFDVAFRAPAQPRPDPCEGLRKSRGQ